MKSFIFTAILLMPVPSFGGDRVTEYSVRFGNGILTKRSDGSMMTTQSFGQGTIQRETFRSGQTATHISTRFGSGYMTRSTGSYVRKP